MANTSDRTIIITPDPSTGLVASVRLYGEELLDQSRPSGAEIMVNAQPLRTRLHPASSEGGTEASTRLKGEQFTDHFSGWALVVSRTMGERTYAKWPSYGVNYHVRRELADMTDLPCPGPGGPVVEAPLFVDTFSMLNWNWKFWGDDTRMVFPSLHSTGPTDEWGHAGYEHDTPARVKAFLRNVWRRIYPGVMGIHGGLFYNASTGHWLAITCRRPNVGYILNIESAGEGVGYDFTLHAPFDIGDALQMPEVKLYYGDNSDQMWKWAADYLTHYYEEPPAWFYKTVWMGGLAWNNEPTWTDQADVWEKSLDSGIANGIGYSLVTNRPVNSGTTPLGYEPDPNHGTIAEFKAMGRRIADRGVPYLVWMSHSGISANAADFDDDWFIRGIDGRMCASWGSVDGGLMHVNPGHPGYIEYTKKWIRFYMRECGAKGIFMDCLGWAFPPDYRPRSFMRYPGDTNRMSIVFMEEIYACIKECDPDGILLGEGTTLDGPVNVFSVHSNPVRSIDGMGPRDFLLWLNRYSPKRIVIDQAPNFNPGSGMTKLDDRPDASQRNKALAELIRAHGSRSAFVALPGDLSVIPTERILIVPAPPDEQDRNVEQLASWCIPDFTLPSPWDATCIMRSDEGAIYEADKSRRFCGLQTGIYHMDEPL